jgi:hypothetical protein
VVPGASTRAFAWAAAAFVVAGLVGTTMRFGMQLGLPFGWELPNVRFAHTHLMYFGWATPALFALLGALVAARTGRPPSRLARTATWGALVAAAASFVPFLLDGYGATEVAGWRLPLSMIASAGALVAWTAWSVAYVVATWDLHRDLALVAVDAAVLALLVASAGAWGLAAAAFAPVAPGVLMDRLVPFYLGVFSSGWFALAVVGLLADALKPRIDEGLGRAAVALLLAGTLVAAFADLLATGPAWLGVAARFAAAYGAVVLGLQASVAAVRAGAAGVGGTGVPVPGVLPRGALLPGALLLGALLAVKGLIEGALAVEAVARWSEGAALPVWLAHGYLLGLVTLALAWSALARWRPTAGAWFWVLAASVAVLLLGIAPLTQAWPFARGAWVLPLAAWTSLAPILPMVGLAWAVALGPRRG